MAAQVETRGSEFKVGAVRPLFDLPALRGPAWVYNPSRDGQRFLVNTERVQAGTAAPLTLVVNWNAGLKK